MPPWPPTTARSSGGADPRPIRSTRRILAAWDDQVSEAEVVYDKDPLDDNRDLGIALIEVYLEEPPPGTSSPSRAPMLAPITNSRGEYLEKPLAGRRRPDHPPGGRHAQGSPRSRRPAGPTPSPRSPRRSSRRATPTPSTRLTGEEPAVEYVVLVKTKDPEGPADRGHPDHRGFRQAGGHHRGRGEGRRSRGLLPRGVAR